MPGFENIENEGKICLVCGQPYEQAYESLDKEDGASVDVCSKECFKEYYKDPERYVKLADDEDFD